MGTFYEIKCLDCDERGGIYADRSPRIAKQALLLADAFAAFGDALGPAMVVSHAWYEVKVSVGGDRIDLYFFHAHRGHRLEVFDGYGLKLGQCFLHTADGKQCVLADGHEGDCKG